MRYNATFLLNSKKDMYGTRPFYFYMLNKTQFINVKSRILGFIRCFRFRFCNIAIKETNVLDLVF